MSQSPVTPADLLEADPFFKVELLSATPFAEPLVRAALGQDYSAAPIFDKLEYRPVTFKSECGLETTIPVPSKKVIEKAGKICVEKLLKGDRGHYGPLEHPAITFNVIRFPHSTMTQARTQRVGVSFDVQSYRYTQQAGELGGKFRKYLDDLGIPWERVIDLENTDAFDDWLRDNQSSVEELFYIRPAGYYADYKGEKGVFTPQDRWRGLRLCAYSTLLYHDWTSRKIPGELARSPGPYDLRQSWVVSFNIRSVFHLLDLRAGGKAAIEIQAMAELMLPHIQAWVPSIFDWYKEYRLYKARLAP